MAKDVAGSHNESTSGASSQRTRFKQSVGDNGELQPGLQRINSTLTDQEKAAADCMHDCFPPHPSSIVGIPTHPEVALVQQAAECLSHVPTADAHQGRTVVEDTKDQAGEHDGGIACPASIGSAMGDAQEMAGCGDAKGVAARESLTPSLDHPGELSMLVLLPTQIPPPSQACKGRGATAAGERRHQTSANAAHPPIRPHAQLQIPAA